MVLHDQRGAGQRGAHLQLLSTAVEEVAPEPTEYERVVSAHAAHYLALLGREGPRLHGAGIADGGRAQVESLWACRHELPNFLQVFDAGVELRRLDWLLAGAQHLRRYLTIDSEFRLLLQRGTEQAAAAQVLASAPLVLQGKLAQAQAHLRLGDLEEAWVASVAAQVVAINVGDKRAGGEALVILGAIEDTRGNFSGARARHEQARAVTALLSSRTAEAQALTALGLAEQRLGNFSQARQCYDRALELSSNAGDRHCEAVTLNNMANLDYNLGDFAAARIRYERALAIRCELGDRSGEAASLNNLGAVEHDQHNYAAARELHLRSLAIKRDLGDRTGESMSLHNLGLVDCRRQDYASAEEFFKAALELRTELGQWIGQAYSLRGLGEVALACGRFGAAGQLYLEALVLMQEAGDQPGALVSCAAAGVLLAAQQDFAPACRALHGAQAAAAAIGYCFDPDERTYLETGSAQLAAALSAGQVSADELAQWQTQGSALSLAELIDDLLAGLASVAAKG